MNMRSMKIKIEKPNLRTVQAEERRLQILDTALTVFASKGFDGTSIKDIANAAGISQGLIYHYFKSKDDLLVLTIEHHSFLPYLRKILADTRSLPIDELFKNIANGLLDMLDKKKMLVRILIREVEVNPRARNAWASLIRKTVSFFQTYLEARVITGELRPHNTEVAARSLFGMMFMYHFTQDVFCSSSTTREEFVETALNNILRGIEQKQ